MKRRQYEMTDPAWVNAFCNILLFDLILTAAEIEVRERIYHYGNNDHNNDSNDHPEQKERTNRRGKDEFLFRRRRE